MARHNLLQFKEDLGEFLTFAATLLTSFSVYNVRVASPANVTVVTVDL